MSWNIFSGKNDRPSEYRLLLISWDQKKRIHEPKYSERDEGKKTTKEKRIKNKKHIEKKECLPITIGWLVMKSFTLLIEKSQKKGGVTISHGITEGGFGWWDGLMSLQTSSFPLWLTLPTLNKIGQIKQKNQSVSWKTNLYYRKSSARARFLPRDSSSGAGGPSPGSEQKYLGWIARTSSCKINSMRQMRRTRRIKQHTGEKLGFFTLRSVGFLNSAFDCAREGLGRVSTGFRTGPSFRGVSKGPFTSLDWDWIGGACNWLWAAGGGIDGVLWGIWAGTNCGGGAGDDPTPCMGGSGKPPGPGDAPGGMKGGKGGRPWPPGGNCGGPAGGKPGGSGKPGGGGLNMLSAFYRIKKSCCSPWRKSWHKWRKWWRRSWKRTGWDARGREKSGRRRHWWKGITLRGCAIDCATTRLRNGWAFRRSVTHKCLVFLKLTTELLLRKRSIFYFGSLGRWLRDRTCRKS